MYDRLQVNWKIIRLTAPPPQGDCNVNLKNHFCVFINRIKCVCAPRGSEIAIIKSLFNCFSVNSLDFKAWKDHCMLIVPSIISESVFNVFAYAADGWLTCNCQYILGNMCNFMLRRFFSYNFFILNSSSWKIQFFMFCESVYHWNVRLGISECMHVCI